MLVTIMNKASNKWRMMYKIVTVDSMKKKIVVIQCQ